MKADKRVLLLLIIFSIGGAHASLLEECANRLEAEYESFIDDKYANFLNELGEKFPALENLNLIEFLGIDEEVADDDPFSTICASNREYQIDHLREKVKLGHLNMTGESRSIFMDNPHSLDSRCSVKTTVVQDEDGNENLNIQVEALVTVEQDSPPGEDDWFEDLSSLKREAERFKGSFSIDLKDVEVHSLSHINAVGSRGFVTNDRDYIDFYLPTGESAAGDSLEVFSRFKDENGQDIWLTCKGLE